MKIKDLIEDCRVWIEHLKEMAKEDEAFSISWFKGTEDSPFSIVGGWSEGFSGYDELLCISKSDPDYSMCVKVAVNDGPYAYVDFDCIDMPYDKETNEVDDTCVALEWEDDSEDLAIWLLGQWERLMKEHGEF